MNNALPLPLDIRLMNWAAAALTAGLMLLVLAGGLVWLLRHPALAIQAITVQGEVSRNNALTLQANVLPQLDGNFYTMDLNQVRDAFEAVPWIRSAVVHREFPYKLKAVLTEHQPLAFWGDEGANTMVNQQGQVFEANAEDVDTQTLPRLKGPADSSANVAQMLRDLQILMGAMNMRIEQLELTPRGSWRVLTDGGASLELGGGEQAQVVARLKAFFKTLSQVTARHGRTPSALLAADLRHPDGYALRLRGVTTVPTDGQKSP